jgi:hypothetical protein
VPVDISAGAHQDHVEDCPVCCHPITLHVDIATDGEAHVGGCLFRFVWGWRMPPTAGGKRFIPVCFVAGAGRGWANLLC